MSGLGLGMRCLTSSTGTRTPQVVRPHLLSDFTWMADADQAHIHMQTKSAKYYHQPDPLTLYSTNYTLKYGQGHAVQ